MAVGKPVAVTAMGGYLDFVEEGENGYLFPAHDAASTADALMKALDAPSSIRTNARRTAERYSTQACVPMLERVYAETVQG
ncbi:MAG: glycosyltransferase [Euryarchaeota archaeon]|nr:glycosyltransferase [Euryarchaeota archaeon]